nr:hypothetical protein CFP56_16953 [Quercus suber]
MACGHQRQAMAEFEKVIEVNLVFMQSPWNAQVGDSASSLAKSTTCCRPSQRHRVLSAYQSSHQLTCRSSHTSALIITSNLDSGIESPSRT